MHENIPAAWPDALWIGDVEFGALRPGDKLQLEGGSQYQRARLLLREVGAPRGFVDVAVVDSQVPADDVLAAGAELPPAALSSAANIEPVSVIVCTRRRPSLLRDALASIVKLDYPEFEILVVNNDPSDAATAEVVAEFDSARIRLLDAPRPGLARARNVGVVHSRYQIVAFTDDDVMVDAAWLRGIAAGFADSAVGCVTGMVASGEINSLPQWYFDRRVTWASSCAPITYSLRTPPLNDRLFPFRVGSYGTGANFAVRRPLLISLGGFDEGMGVGSPTGGGEDIDMFVRVIFSDSSLAYRPDALVWHRHRSDMPALEQQTRAYGRGLGAWLTKLVFNRRTAGKVLSRSRAGLRHLGSITDVQMNQYAELTLGKLGWAERLGAMSGPLSLVVARLQGRRSRPLRGYGVRQ